MKEKYTAEGSVAPESDLWQGLWSLETAGSDQEKRGGRGVRAAPGDRALVGREQFRVKTTDYFLA